MSFKFLVFPLLALIFTAIPIEKVLSDTPAVQFNRSDVNPSYTVSFSNTSGGFNLGFEFMTTTAVTVTALGYFDSGNGFLNNHPVGLYDLQGNLLASTVVTNADGLQGVFRYSSISPLTLAANTAYVIGAVTGYDPGNPVDLYTHDPSTIAFDSSIQFIQNREAMGTANNLVFPDFSETSVDPPLYNAWFGPNMLLATPEPGTLLVLGGGLAAAVLRRRRKG